MDTKIFLTIVTFCFGFNAAFAQSCNDINQNCKNWPDNFCQKYKDYMKRNCPLKCGYCQKPTGAPGCDDKRPTSSCVAWKKYNYCDASSQYHPFMKDNCKKTCGFCGTPPATAKPTQTTQPSGSCSLSQRLRSCSFASDTCDFIDVPFDDDHDFVLRSSGGQDNQGGYLSSSGSGEAHLILPLELVLPHKKDYGNMCMELYYRISARGSLLLHQVQNAKGYPKQNTVRLSGTQNSWKKAKFTFRSSQFNHLLIESSPNAGSVDIDNVRFCDGNCS